MASSIRGMSRRDFLRSMALGGSSLAFSGALGSGVLSALAQGTVNPAVDVTLYTSGWPMDMPLADAQAGTFAAGYAKAWQAWLDMNPGVKVELIEFNPWDAAGLRTSVAGGTAPFTYPIGVLGNWNVSGIQAAFATGGFADITEAFNKYNLTDLLDPRVAASSSRWMASDGRVFGIPYEVVSSQGYFYNRAHLEELGIDKIPMTWTWQDMREWALKLTTPDRKGMAMAAYALNWILPSYGIGFDGLVSRYPVPGRSFNWRWDFQTFADDMVEGVDLWRGMYFEDQSVFSDPNYWDFSQNGPLAAAFYDGRASMTPGISLFFSDMAHKMNISVAEADQMMSFVRAPLGPKGYTERPISPSAWGFSPDLSAEQLDKAVSLFSYMLLGDGFVQTMQDIYNTTGDLGAVVGAIRWPYANRYSDIIPGIDGSLKEAIGSDYSASLDEIFSQPVHPEIGAYVPAEVNSGPGDTPWYDKIIRWAFSQDAVDVKADTVEMESILNQQAVTFPRPSMKTPSLEGINRYYADWDALLQVTAPDFYEQRFKPFYDLRIKPNFG